MTENLHFLHHERLWPVLLGGTVLWLLFLWKENPKKPNIRFFGNGLVALIAVISLAMMILKPMAMGKVETAAAALLTNAYSKERLDSLRRVYSGFRVIPYQMNKDIGAVLDSVAPLFVLGDGIRPFDFWQFDSVPVTYLGSGSPKGIIALKYDREITVGEALAIRGRFNVPEKGHRLVLAGPGGTGLDSVALDSGILASAALDSAAFDSLPTGSAAFNSSLSNPSPTDSVVLDRLSSNPMISDSLTSDSVVSAPVVSEISQQTNFSLSTEMKVKGSYTYFLIEKDSTGKTIQSEPLPLTVLSKTPLKVLLVNSFPTFESKYLKNYLAEMGHELTVRTQLTKGKYKFEYFNRDSNPVYALSREQLEALDVLIIDSESYTNLSEKAKNALIETMEKDGLGVFVQPDNRFFSAPKRTSNFDFVGDESTEIRLQNWPELWADKFPFRFEPALGLENIHGNGDNIHGMERNIRETSENIGEGGNKIHDSEPKIRNYRGKILTAYRRIEKGRIGTTTIQNTYKWILDGHSTAYQEFWSAIISVISKRQDISTTWSDKTEPIFPNMPYTFDVRTTVDRPEIIGFNGEEIPIEQHPNIPELWTGTIYPRKTGWNELSIRNDSTSTHRIFVMGSVNFQALSRHNIQQANKRLFNGTSSITQKKSVPQRISNIWFFIVFLTAMGWLWLSPKI